MSSPNGISNLCWRRAFSEHCQSYSSRDNGSVGHPSITWPLSVACMLWIFGFGYFRLCLWSLQDANCQDEKVVAQISWGEIFAQQVREPVTELIVTRCDKAALLAVKGMVDIEIGVSSIAVMREVLGLYVISQEDSISPFLHTQFCPIYCGRMHRQPCPRICRPSQATCALDLGPF